MIKEWKQSIRQTLIEVKENFIEWIDNFTNKFVKSLNKIEQSRELIEFAGEDKRLTLQVLDIQNKYLQIVKIFQNIQRAPAAQKLDSIENMRPQMRRLEQEVINQDRHIKKQAAKVKKALRETVELDGLHQKIMGKYLRFLQQKVAGKMDEDANNMQSSIQNTRGDPMGDRLGSELRSFTNFSPAEQNAEWQFESMNISAIPMEQSN